MTETTILYYGTDEPPPERIPLRAGPLHLIYEAGDLRSIRLGDREIVQRIYGAVRDRNWGTVPARLFSVHVDSQPDSFSISFEAGHARGEIDFHWMGTITGTSEGTITFRFDGTARSTFLRNRIGLCVLHPMRECAGEPFTARKASGGEEDSVFPELIARRPVCYDIRGLSYGVAPDVQVDLLFEGDIFEMEDQRNWTDASYKTYSTPSDLPIPVEVPFGARIQQSVTLSLRGVPWTVTGDERPMGVTIQPSGPPVPMPQLGVAVASHGEPLTAGETRRLKALRLSHLRVELRLYDAAYEAALFQAHREASALGVPLEIALIVSWNARAELQGLRRLIDTVRPRVARWLVFHRTERGTAEQWVTLARQFLASHSPRADWAGGARYSFVEANQNRPPMPLLDGLVYSINPQTHAFDLTSLVETTEGIPATVETARSFAEGKPILISPVTFKIRESRESGSPADAPAPDALPPQVDPRQMSLFGAGWTLGALKALAESGVYSVTFYETTGWLGVMERESGSPVPDQFHSTPGQVFPLYHVLADAGEFAGGEVLPTASSDARRIQALWLRHPGTGRERVLVANLTATAQTVHLPVPEQTERLSLRRLDETTAEQATQYPRRFRSAEAERAQVSIRFSLTLRPYAVAAVDFGADNVDDGIDDGSTMDDEEDAE